MNAAVLALIVLLSYALAYRFYSRFLARRVFDLRADETVPSRELADGVDYVPTRLSVLWGHHYTSIAGAAPIVGPALAVIWGWLPALLWVMIGTITMGAVHDFAALVISLRHRGRSVGEIAGEVISPAAQRLFLIVVAFLIWIVLAVFAFIIGTLFKSHPASIFPINVQIIVALGLGWLVYRRGVPVLVPSLIGFAVLFVSVFYGQAVVLLMVYSFVASVLPVWLLLQPRDYLNSHQLLLGLAAMLLGLMILAPEIQAPALNPHPEGAPPLLPFLFITIACGAISGFHGLVSSGTTSKQVACMTDARPIGYGGMLGEGTLGMLAVLATTAGFATSTEWHVHYASWSAASGLAPKLDAFVRGAGGFVAQLGIEPATAQTFIAVMVIAFAATSLDTGARILRLILSELGASAGIRPLANRYVASGIGIGAALVLAITQAGGKGGLILWPLFGTTNQLLAALTLTVVSVWLRKTGRPYLYTFVPMLLVVTATIIAMLGEVRSHVVAANWLLAGSASCILVLSSWVVIEGVRALGRSGDASAGAR
jgi:carbon starvation protein